METLPGLRWGRRAPWLTESLRPGPGCGTLFLKPYGGGTMASGGGEQGTLPGTVVRMWISCVAYKKSSALR